MKKNLQSAITLIAFMALLASGSALRAANYAFHLTLNINPVTSPSDAYSLDLAMTGGVGGNTLTASNFTLNNGGSFLNSASDPFGFSSGGSVTGNFASSLTFTTAAGSYQEIAQKFSLGTTNIQFDVVTTQVQGGTPDNFTVTLLDNSTGSPVVITTTEPVLAQNLVTLDVSSSNTNADVKTYSSDGTVTPSGIVAVVPEPNSFGLCVVGMMMMAWSTRRRSRTA